MTETSLRGGFPSFPFDLSLGREGVEIFGESGYQFDFLSPAKSLVARPPALEPQLAIKILEFNLKLAYLERQNNQLARRVTELEDSPRPFLVPINTFAPRPFEPTQVILVLVEPVLDDSGEPCEFLATLTDASIAASGFTVEEAVVHLKDRILSKFDLLDGMPEDRLGVMPKRQIAALRSLIRRIVSAEKK